MNTIMMSLMVIYDYDDNIDSDVDVIVDNTLYFHCLCSHHCRRSYCSV